MEEYLVKSFKETKEYVVLARTLDLEGHPVATTLLQFGKTLELAKTTSELFTGWNCTGCLSNTAKVQPT